ncbi:hypothetical protein, partial [Rothia kristinae]|uniref:hypothetical protein n=1 Tax=Rothia kristinae TaxID=37923 RepID=UPI001F60454D
MRTAVPSAMQPSPKGADERIAAYRASLERLAPVAPGAVFVTNTGPAPDGDMHRGLEEAVRFHRELAPVAADLGVRLAVEPLNPVPYTQLTPATDNH